MQTPLQITFRGMDPSEAIEQDIRRRALRLERMHPRLTRCHVVVDLPHRHHHKGNHYVVHLELATPLGEVSVTHDPPLAEERADFKAVIRDAFDAAARRLDRQRRDDTERASGGSASGKPQSLS
jgi:ribosome-associated translation inhibitor RaiA